MASRERPTRHKRQSLLTSQSTMRVGDLFGILYSRVRPAELSDHPFAMLPDIAPSLGFTLL